MIDLHTHSTASDGTFSPRELVEAASVRGLTALALTDHDTMAGWQEAGEAALKAGIRFIPGIEIEIAFEPGECHLLGLGLYSPAREFYDALEDLMERRKARNFAILDLMRKEGIEVEYSEIEAFAGGKVVGRPHFARFLIEKKLVKNMELAFSRYLGKGKPFYMPRESMEMEQAIQIIHASGGKAVLAHPLSLYVSWGHLPSIIERWRDCGLDGLEAWHSNAKVRECERLEKLAADLGMFVTAGSDFHGENRPERKLGLTAGGRRIEERFLEYL